VEFEKTFIKSKNTLPAGGRRPRKSTTLEEKPAFLRRCRSPVRERNLVREKFCGRDKKESLTPLRRGK